MRRGSTVVISSLMLTLFWALVVSDLCYGAEKSDMGGWEWGGPYNRLYVASERDKFKERSWRSRTSPLFPGCRREWPSSSGVRTAIRWKFILAPDGSSIQEMGIRKGDKVTLKGCWAEVGNKEVFLTPRCRKGRTLNSKSAAAGMACHTGPWARRSLPRKRRVIDGR